MALEIQQYRRDPPSRGLERELWAGTEMNRDLFEADALSDWEGFLGDRLERYARRGPGLIETVGSLFGWRPDSDGDGVKDRQELRLGTNPFVADRFR